MHFFPVLYPDELLYSAFARYHAYSGNESFKNTMRDLFGSMTVCAVTDLPAHLDILGKRIPGRSISKQMLLFNHTLLPYYGPFLPKDRLEDVISEMMYGCGQSVHMKTGLTACRIKNSRNLKYCPSCVIYDRDRYGVAYWHRSHQLPGVTVCYKHHILLIDSAISFASRRNKHEYVSLETIVENRLSGEIIVKCPFNLFIAKVSNQLLNMETLFKISTDQLKNQYLQQLQTLNFLSVKGRVKFKDLIPKFTGYYGNNFLTRMGCNIEPFQQDTWIHKVFRNSRDVIHPLRHILLHGFFGKDIIISIKNPNDVFISAPFGNGPWICLNKAAIHYGKEIVSICEISRCSSTGKPVGTFKCSCGFIYSRRGPDNTLEDRMRIGRIKDFGEIWKRKLNELLNMDNLSLREKAMQLGVDPMTVRRQSVLLTSEKDKLDFVKKREKRQIILEKRKSWLLLKDEKKSDDRRGVYSWLYRNDKEWLLQNKPSIECKTPKINRINWKERDMELSVKVRETAGLLMSEKKVRISKTEIGRRIGALSLISNQLEKMPITKKELENVVESTEEYQLRRVELSIMELMKTNCIVKEWKVAKIAGLRQEASIRLKEDIHRLIKDMAN